IILYGDIIRQDFMDTYNNLTLKAIMAFWWVTEFCSNSRFLTETDTDVFINTANLIKFLLKLNSSEIFLLVILSLITLPTEALTKKHTSCMMNSGCTLCIAYILDGKLALRIYELMSHIKPIKFEDVYVGFGLNLLTVNISIPEDNQQFFLNKINFDTCKYRHFIAVHGITSSEIISYGLNLLEYMKCHQRIMLMPRSWLWRCFPDSCLDCFYWFYKYIIPCHSQVFVLHPS
uniref:Hexosyltransferase n=1 Tax=Amazona collaria TaxID=241587 RepID=A0A8B9FJI8_9PSIT